MPRLPRIAKLLIGLTALLSWIAFDGARRTESSSAKTPPASVLQVFAGAGTSVSTVVRPGVPVRLPLGKIAADPFSSQAWFPATKRTSAVASLPASVPPLPFRFAGRLHEGTDIQTFLARGDDVFPVHIGDTLDGGYRVESISDGGVTLVYLPAGVRQIVEVGPPLGVHETLTPTDGAPPGQPAAGTAPGAAR